MAVELACENCEGRLRVETPETVVACPHCGTHLSVSAEQFSASNLESAANGGPPSEEPRDEAAPTEAAPPQSEFSEQFSFHETSRDDAATATEVAASQADEMPDFGQLDAFDTGPGPRFPVEEEASISTDSNTPEPVSDGEEAASSPVSEEQKSSTVFVRVGEHGPAFPVECPGTAGLAAAFAADFEPPRSATAPPEASPAAEDWSPPVEQIPATNGSSRPQAPGSPTSRLLLISYASAVTLAFLYLLFLSYRPNPHQLESLPDIVPRTDEDGNIMPTLVPEDAPMAPGHTLKLGQTQRFGNLRVTPLRVTREPLHFEHYSGDDRFEKPPTQPVLKLWLRFENVSEDQSFAPLDRPLMLTRHLDQQDATRLRANNFLCRLADKHRDGQRVFVYDEPAESNYDFKNQQAGKPLEPGDVVETYIPTTEEGLDSLTGDLVWRVHFRKGYNPQSRRGVTTLIEVRFDSDEIEENRSLAGIENGSPSRS